MREMAVTCLEQAWLGLSRERSQRSALLAYFSVPHITPSENRVSWFRAGVAKNGVQRARLGETRATPLIYNAATISVVLVCVLI